MQKRDINTNYFCYRNFIHTICAQAAVGNLQFLASAFVNRKKEKEKSGINNRIEVSIEKESCIRDIGN
jgi:hypothetical protein